jgi:superfamily II DNA or RNA helicase
MVSLRPYQYDAIAEFHRTVAIHKRIILAAPTGAGKTIIGASIITDLIRDVNKSVLVLAHRREIIKQTAEKLLEAGISHGMMPAAPAGARPGRLDPDSLDARHAHRKHGFAARRSRLGG